MAYRNIKKELLDELEGCHTGITVPELMKKESIEASYNTVLKYLLELIIDGFVSCSYEKGKRKFYPIPVMR